MSQFAILLGTKNGKRIMVAEGDPREIRDRFKKSDGEGYELLEVLESSIGRSRHRRFKDDALATQVKKAKAK
jgi:uncharacterized protein (UPF0128 family)